MNRRIEDLLTSLHVYSDAFQPANSVILNHEEQEMFMIVLNQNQALKLIYIELLLANTEILANTRTGTIENLNN